MKKNQKKGPLRNAHKRKCKCNKYQNVYTFLY